MVSFARTAVVWRQVIDFSGTVARCLAELGRSPNDPTDVVVQHVELLRRLGGGPTVFALLACQFNLGGEEPLAYTLGNAAVLHAGRRMIRDTVCE